MKPKFILAASLLALSATAAAQSYVQAHEDSLKHSHHVIMFGDGETVGSDSIQKVINNFYVDQFRNAHEPDAPHFMFMSKDAKLAMGIGGSVRVRGWYDWGGYVPDYGFVTSEIPMSPTAGNRRSLNGTVNGSRLFFKMLGQHQKFGHYQVYLEAKFYGNNGSNFKLSKAYATINDWTVGYATSTFADPAANPFTVDAEGPNAAISDTDILVRWMHTFKKNWVVAASMEMPNADDATPTDYYGHAEGWLPNVAAFWQYQWNDNEHVRLSGIMRFLPYRDLVKSENRNEMGWGVKLSSVFTPGSGPVTLYLNGLYGQGIAGITNDLGGMNLDLLGSPDELGKMYAPAVFGCFGGVQYNFSPSLFASACVSELRFLPKESVTPDTYRYGLYGAFNVCYYITPRFFVGAEFDLGCLKDFSMQKHWANRAGVIAQLSF